MNHDKYDEALAEQAAREHRHECAMFEVDILVWGTHREIYHIVAATKEAAVKQALDGFTSPNVRLHDHNYEPEGHTRELYEVYRMA